MKALVVFILIILGLVLFMMFGPAESGKPAAQPQPAAVPQGAPSTAAQAPATGRQAGELSRPAASTGIAADVGAVINYGIGATQLEAKKRAQSNVNKANESHNRTLNESLSR